MALTGRAGRGKLQKSTWVVVRWLVLLIIVVWSVFPIYLIFSSSLKKSETIFAYPPALYGKPTIENYIELPRQWPTFLRSLVNSIVITVCSVGLTLLVCLPAAFAFSRYRGRGLRLAGFFIIVARMFPPIIITIPFYPIFQRLGLIDKPVVLIILYSAFYVSIGVWILKNAMDNIPQEFEEAAYLEGCTQLKTFLQITLPLSSPGIVSTSILVAIFCWKEFFFAFLYTTFKAVTAPVVLNEMLGSMFGISWGPLFAATSIQLLPILVFIWFVQKYLIRGIAYSSEK